MALFTSWSLGYKILTLAAFAGCLTRSLDSAEFPNRDAQGREIAQGEMEQHYERKLTGNNITRSSYYRVSWGLEASGCDNHFMSIDLHCEGILLLLPDDDGNNSSTCFYLNSNATLLNWIRCTSTVDSKIDYEGDTSQFLASTRVRCVGDTVESHSLWAQTVPLTVSCDDPGVGTVRVRIHRLIPSATGENSGNIFDQADATTTVVDTTVEDSTDWTQTNISYGCVNSKKDNPAGEGQCYEIHPVFCSIVYSVIPFLYCPPVISNSVVAAVYYSGVDEDYLLPATKEDSELFWAAMLQGKDKNMDLGRINYPTNSSSAITTEGDLLQRATYKVYFDTRSDDSSTCLIPPPEVLLLCGSGIPPSSLVPTMAICANIQIPHSGIKMSRCITDSTVEDYTSSVVASCDGMSATQRELFVYMGATDLSRCQKDPTQNQTVNSYVWPSPMCGEEATWGEKRTCWASTGNGTTDSVGQDYCSSAFAGCDGLGQNCTSSLLAASVSVDDDSCLELAPDPDETQSPTTPNDTGATISMATVQPLVSPADTSTGSPSASPSATRRIEPLSPTIPDPFAAEDAAAGEPTSSATVLFGFCYHSSTLVSVAAFTIYFWTGRLK